VATAWPACDALPRKTHGGIVEGNETRAGHALQQQHGAVSRLKANLAHGLYGSAARGLARQPVREPRFDASVLAVKDRPLGAHRLSDSQAQRVGKGENAVVSLLARAVPIRFSSRSQLCK